VSRRGHCRTLPSSSARDCPARGQRSKTTRRSDVKSWTRARSTATSTTPTVRRLTSSRWGSSRGGPVLRRVIHEAVPSASTSTSSPTANCLPPRPPSPVPPRSPDLAQVTSPAEPDVASHENNGTPQAGSSPRQNDQVCIPPPVGCGVAARVHIGGSRRLRDRCGFDRPESQSRRTGGAPEAGGGPLGFISVCCADGSPPA
jgi:hypothetical protein